MSAFANAPSGSESYRASTIRRNRRTKAGVEKIREAIVDILDETSPMTVRQVFYALTVRGLIEKTEGEYNQTVVRLLTQMRWDGAVSWNDISDSSRWIHKIRSFSGVDDAIARTARFYRRDLWAASDDYIEIWCEKEALAGVVAEVTGEYDVPLMVSRGFSSGSYLRQAAEKITETCKPSFIYQLGDYDPSGLWITEQINRDLQRHLGDIGEFDLDDFYFERIAVTEVQIKEWDLPTRPTKREGNTHAKNFNGESVEL
jgi:hypothetical protein